MNLISSFLTASLGFLPLLARADCNHDEVIRSCNGNACSRIDISCEEDQIIVSRGFDGYFPRETAIFTIDIPVSEEASWVDGMVLAFEMDTEDTHDTLSLVDGAYSFSGTGTYGHILPPGTHTMTWQTDTSVEGRGWKVTMVRADSLPIFGQIMGILTAFGGCCLCVCCVAIAACCACCRSGSGSRPVAAPGSTPSYAAQASPQQQEMQQQPMNYGGAPGYNPASAPFMGQPGFQPQMGGFPQQQMGGFPQQQMGGFPQQPMDGNQPQMPGFQPQPGGFQPQPGFQFQPQPGQAPAFQYQPGAP